MTIYIRLFALAAAIVAIAWGVNSSDVRFVIVALALYIVAMGDLSITIRGRTYKWVIRDKEGKP